MPMYNYKCIACGKIMTDVLVHSREYPVSCDSCGSDTIREFPKAFSARSFPADGLHLKNVSSKGKTFHSRREMVSYANEHNLDLGAL